MTSTAAAANQQRVHSNEVFTFVAKAPVAKVFPLFGADGERVWAPGWEPRFLWPMRPNDQTGMVFQIAHADAVATWINTVFDSSAGRAQYVYVLPEVMATLITLDVQPRGDATEVSVRYERTSLSPRSDATVKAMAGKDRGAGPEWAAQINSWLARSTRD